MKSDIYVLTSARDVCVTDSFCCFCENQNNLSSCCFCKNSINKLLYLTFCSFEFLVQKCGISDISAFPRCQRSRRSVNLPSSMNQSAGGYWSLNVIAVLHKPALLLSPCRSSPNSQLKERVLRIFLHLFIWAARARIPSLQLNAQQMSTSHRFEQLNMVTGVGAHLCTMMLFYSDLQKCTVELYELQLLIKLQIKSIFTSLLTKRTDLQTSLFLLL